MKIRKSIFAGSLSMAVILSGCGLIPFHDSIPEAEATVEIQTGKTTEELKEETLLAYQELLRNAPAIVGDPEELLDPSFGYEENQEMFGDHYDLFAIVDINQDEIPELLALTIVNYRWTPLSVFTGVDGKAVLLKDPMNFEAHGTFEQMSTANGFYTTYICEEHHLHSVWSGTDPMGEEVQENCAYTLAGMLTMTGCITPENENTIYFDSIAKRNTPENIAEIIQ